jgi:hypothetical protein
LKTADDFVVTDPARTRLRDGFAQRVSPRLRSVLTRRGASDVDDERSETETTLNETQMLEFAIGTMHRVGIDRDLANNLAHGRQLVTYLEFAPIKGVSDLIDELTKWRSIRTSVEAKDNGWLVAHVLVH